MKPISYSGTDVDTDIHFHYSFSQLKEFIKHGKENGAVGMIIMSKVDNIIKYKGFGTIENPRTTIMTWYYNHYSAWNGKWDHNKIMNPKPAFDFESYGVIIPLKKKEVFDSGDK